MNYLSAIIYISMILDFNELVNGSSLSLPAHGRVGARATVIGGAFREAKYEIRRRRNPSSSPRFYRDTTGQGARERSD